MTFPELKSNNDYIFALHYGWLMSMKPFALKLKRTALKFCSYFLSITLLRVLCLTRGVMIIRCTIDETNGLNLPQQVNLD